MVGPDVAMSVSPLSDPLLNNKSAFTVTSVNLSLCERSNMKWKKEVRLHTPTRVAFVFYILLSYNLRNSEE